MVDSGRRGRLNRRMQVYVSKDGQQYGPHTVEQLREYLAQGSFVPTDFACQAGSAEWVTVEQILQTLDPTATAPVPSAQVTTTQTGNPQQQQSSSQKQASQHVQVAPAPKTKSRPVILWISIGSAFVAILTVLIFLISGSSEPDLSDPDVVEDATADAVEWSKLQDRSGVTHLPNTEEPYSGYAQRTYENEQIEALARFKDGYVVRVKKWQENGTPMWDIGLIEGKIGVEKALNPIFLLPMKVRHGPVTIWHKNGQKKAEGNLEDGKEDGLFSAWYENGQKMGEENWKDGKKDGPWTQWYESGQKRSEGNFKDDNIVSLVVWHPNGQKCSATNVKDGNGFQVNYYENGQKMAEGNWKDGKQNGPATIWHENGQKKSEGNLKDNKKDGVWIDYNEYGTEKSRETYKDGEQVYD